MSEGASEGEIITQPSGGQTRWAWQVMMMALDGSGAVGPFGSVT